MSTFRLASGHYSIIINIRGAACSSGVRTPTDEAYEADQELEADLLALLDEIEQGLEGVI